MAAAWLSESIIALVHYPPGGGYGGDHGIQRVVGEHCLIPEGVQIEHVDAGFLVQVSEDFSALVESVLAPLIALVWQSVCLQRRSGHYFQKHRAVMSPDVQGRNLAICLLPEFVEQPHTLEGHRNHVGVRFVQTRITASNVNIASPQKFSISHHELVSPSEELVWFHHCHGLP